MKNFLLSLIALLMLGIFVFLGMIYFNDDSSDEVARSEEESNEEVIAAEEESSNEKKEKEIEEEESEEEKSPSDEEKEENQKSEENKDIPAAVELETELNKQDIVVEGVEYIIQDDQYKNLYPDMLSTIATNNTDIDIRDITHAYVAWDKNGLPMKIKGSIDFSDGQYVFGGIGNNVNIAPGETFGRDYGFEIDSGNDGVYTMKAIIVEYEGFNGENWTNPLYSEFKNIYEGKRLADIEGHEDLIYYRYGGPSNSNNEVKNDKVQTFDETNKVTAESENISSEVEDFITQYLNDLESAYATTDFSLISDDLISGTAAYTELRNNINNNSFPNLTIYSIDVTEVQQNGDNIYIEVRTDRTNDNLDGVYEFITGYTLIYENGVFKIEGYSDL